MSVLVLATALQAGPAAATNTGLAPATPRERTSSAIAASAGADGAPISEPGDGLVVTLEPAAGNPAVGETVNARLVLTQSLAIATYDITARASGAVAAATARQTIAAASHGVAQTVAVPYRVRRNARGQLDVLVHAKNRAGKTIETRRDVIYVGGDRGQVVQSRASADDVDLLKLETAVREGRITPEAGQAEATRLSTGTLAALRTSVAAATNLPDGQIRMASEARRFRYVRLPAGSASM